MAKNVAARRKIKPKNEPKIGEYSNIGLNASPPEIQEVESNMNTDF
jgi:hypothetical protein